MHCFADVFKQLARHQRLGVEGHVAHTAPRTVKMRRESEAIYTASRTGQDGRGAFHAQAHPQRAKGRAHALRLIVRSGIGLAWVITGVLLQDFGFTGLLGRCNHGFGAGMATQAIALQRTGRGGGWTRVNRDGACHGLFLRSLQAAS